MNYLNNENLAERFEVSLGFCYSPLKRNKWHIPYLSLKDKHRIETGREKIGCTDYELIQGIDACLKTFLKASQ